MQDAMISFPERSGGRYAAQELLAELPDSLQGTVVTVDCSRMTATSPSYIDEVIRQVVIERGASRIVLRDAQERVAFHATSAAQRRELNNHVKVVAAK